jgi:pimeloyl-ACP methyl ester carboxylesterase
MGPSFPVRSATVRANGLEFGLLEAGAGPLALCLHEVLGGGGDAVLIGHDWGAEAAYGAAAHAPDRWRRLVTLAVPPASMDPVLFSDYEQLKRFFYLFLFRDPAGFAGALVARSTSTLSPGSAASAVDI